MPRSDVTSSGQSETVVASSARTISGDTGVLSYYGGMGKLIAQLNVTAAGGVTPTLDVVIEDSVDGGTTWNTIVTFTQATTVTRQVQRYTSSFTDTLRVRWTVAGTTPSFTFDVRLYSEV